MAKIVIELDDSILDIAKNNQRFYPVYLFEKIWKAIVKGVSLDDIKAEIIEEKDCAYADFEEYKVEYLGQDWEDVEDSLPQDDFRYGMERCIEILNKYRTKNED